ncbi:MAG: hypothetical protein V3V16_01845 [Melioribacteraceae bacterium]
MNKFIKIFLTFAVLLIFSVACKDAATEPEQAAAESFSMKEIEVPEALTNSSNPKAISAKSQILVLNSLPTLYGAWFTVASGPESLAKVNDDRTYTWNSNGVAITMKYSDSGDEIFREIFISGNYGGQTHSNFKFLESRQKKDRSQGYFKIFDFSDGSETTSWVWTTSSDNVYSMNFLSDDGDKIEVNSNPDKSGTISQYENNVMISKTVWTANGTGEWWQYDNQGNVTDSGSWNPPA